jgi:division protein CdvB (Snf7/Vps24/ESCRT-III family)
MIDKTNLQSSQLHCYSIFSFLLQRVAEFTIEHRITNKYPMGAFSSKSSSSTSSKVRSPPPSVTAIDRTVLDLKNARDRLQRYRKRLEIDDARLLEKAIQAKQSGRTETAIGILRLRKFKRQQLSNCEDQLLNVLQMVETIDSKQNEAQILQAMKAGKDALQKMHEETTVEHVIELMDQIAEEHAVEQEINEILSHVPALDNLEDEQAIQAELEALMATTTTTQNEILPDLPIAPTDQPLPNAPTANIKVPSETTTATTSGNKESAQVPLPA